MSDGYHLSQELLTLEKHADQMVSLDECSNVRLMGCLRTIGLS